MECNHWYVVWKVEMVLNPFFHARKRLARFDLAIQSNEYETTSIIVNLASGFC